MGPAIQLSDFDYELPREAIAQEPAEPRDAARLCVHFIGRDETVHARVRELPSFLASGDLVVVNDTRVRPARLFGRRPSGGAVELLLLEPLPPVEENGGRWRVLARPAAKLRAGETLVLADGELEAEPEERLERGTWIVRLAASGGEAVLDAIERVGTMPLPPYINRTPGDPRAAHDRERYQTVYAREPGAAAAPTAGLHFTPELLARLERDGIERASLTLHVGPGTFLPVESEDVDLHRMHAETFSVPPATAAAFERCRARQGRVLAVGTTSARALESAIGSDGRLASTAGETRLFLRPGSSFRAVDILMTNFHLPRSTLLMLVAAFAGRERTLRLYREALAQGYRFYSYGDAMLLMP